MDFTYEDVVAESMSYDIDWFEELVEFEKRNKFESDCIDDMP